MKIQTRIETFEFGTAQNLPGKVADQRINSRIREWEITGWTVSKIDQILKTGLDTSHYTAALTITFTKEMDTADTTSHDSDSMVANSPSP